MQKKRLLIVDDDADLLSGLKSFLESEYLVCTVTSGTLALESFSQNPADLVITDLNMPGMSGVRLCQNIKRLSQGRYVPVVLLTGSADEKSGLLGFEAGADDFLTKPFNPLFLLAKCRAMARAKDFHDQLEVLNHELEKKVKHQVVELQKINRLRKYFSPGMVDNIIEGDQVDSFGEIPKRKKVTVLFSDIRNFAKISDYMEPKEVKKLLDNYLYWITESVFKYHGTVNKILGDGALALFGDGLNTQNHLENAIRAALSLKECAGKIAEQLPKAVRPYFKIGMGVHTGDVLLGNVGSGVQVDYTAVGSTVNLAARLQAFSTDNNIMTTSESLSFLQCDVEIKNQRLEKVKGFENKVKICEVVGFT